MLLQGVVEQPSRSHSPFKGVAGKQTFLEKPYNEKDYSQDDMSIKDERRRFPEDFDREPYVPVAIAKKHISLMETDMRRMKENYGKTMKDLEQGYLKLEEKTREIYKRTLNTWRNKAKNKIKQFQDALKRAVEERDEIETTLKERIKKLRTEKERVDKEKLFLVTENQAGKEQIEEKAKLLDDIKQSYQNEIKEKDDIIDEREARIEKMKDEHEQVKTKFEEEKLAIVSEKDGKISEIKVKLEEEISQREELQRKYNELEVRGVVITDPEMAAMRRAKRDRSLDDDDRSEGDIQDLIAPRDAVGEMSKMETIIPVAAVPSRGDTQGSARRSIVKAGVVGLASEETKALLERIDKLETENINLQEDKMQLAKAIKDMNEALKEAKRVEKIQEHQINDAERQGAEIIPAEVVEERQNKTSLKKKKTKKGKNLQSSEKQEVEDEVEVFIENPEVKKMVEDLVPEEHREDNIEDAERIMMIQTSKDEQLVKKVEKLSKENSLLQKALKEQQAKIENTKKGGDEDETEGLKEQNTAYITKIKALNKQVEELNNKINAVESRPVNLNVSNEEGNDTIAAVGAQPFTCNHGVEIEKLKEEIRDLEEKVAVLEEENIHIQDSENRERDRANKLDEDISELRKNYAELSKQKAGSKNATNGAEKVLQDQLAAVMAENQELKEHNKQIGGKAQPTKRLEVKLEKKDREIEKLHQKIEALENKIDQADNSKDESPGKKGKKAGAGAVSSDTRAMKNKDKEIAKLKSKVEKLEDRIETLTITADARKEEIKSLQTITKDQERELKGMKSEIVTVGKSKDKSLKQQEKAKEKLSAAAAAKERELQMKMDKTSGALSSQLDQLKKEMADMQKDYESKIAVLKDQSNFLNAQLTESEEGIRQRDKEIKELRKKIEEMSLEVGEAHNLMAEHKELKKKQKELTNEFGMIEVKYKEEVKKRKKLHNQIEDMKGKIRVFARVRPMNKSEKQK